MPLAEVLEGLINMGAFEDLVSGNFFNSILSPVSTLIGSEMLYLILWASVLGLVFLRTRSWGFTIMATMLSSIAFAALIPPMAQRFVFIFIIGGLTYVFWLVFRRGG